MAKKKKYYQSRKDRKDESMAMKKMSMKNMANPSWFGVSEGKDGRPPQEVITHIGSYPESYCPPYEEGMNYTDKMSAGVAKGLKKQKM